MLPSLTIPLRVSWADDKSALPTVASPPAGGPLPRAASPPSLPHGLAHVSLRTRRLLAQLTALVFLLGVVGMWTAGGPRGTWELVRVGRLGESPSQVAAPGTVVGAGGSWGWAAKAADESDESYESDEAGGVAGDGAMTEDESDAIAIPESAADPTSPEHGLTPPPDPLVRWGMLSPRASQFTGGLSPWPANPAHAEADEPLSSLGSFADDIYKQGPATADALRAQLAEMVDIAFPDHLRGALRDGLARYMSHAEGAPWDSNKHVWQTDKEGEHRESSEVRTWKGSNAHGWGWTLMSDKDADEWVGKTFGGKNHILELWRNLPSGILRSDTLRYLLLLVEGGIYSDTDTTLLKPPSRWGSGARLYNNGQGWLTPTQLARLEGGEALDDVIGAPSVVVGLEADVGTRADWFDWWPRPIQIAQWTMALAPAHPIAMGAVLRVLHSTADAADWAAARWAEIKALRADGRYDDADRLEAVTVMHEPKEGGPVGVMAWTGPGVWTDAVLTYLRTKYGVQWTELRGIREPLRIGDVVVLPVTGFSPGVGNFGAGHRNDVQAMVQHGFRGSWKDKHD
ncbi:hypothetical protein Q5752_002015 [Cryptotrichosporon argae]